LNSNGGTARAAAAETTTDAEILLAGENLERCVVCRKTHAVGVAGQHLIDVEQQIQRFVECDLVPSEQIESSGCANAFQGGIDHGGIDGVWAQAFQAQQDRAIGAMTAAGEGERSVQLRRHLCRALEQTALGQ
jgi:hypothetical protein